MLLLNILYNFKISFKIIINQCMKHSLNIILLAILVTLLTACKKNETRINLNFSDDWYFQLGDMDSSSKTFEWKKINLPHDWSIEGEFSEDNPATPGGGALPGGIGWYKKIFTLPDEYKDKVISVDFDGIYMNSEVWVNGNYIGKRPNGYISFRYDITSFVKFGNDSNEITVKVDNSKQPNSRWYSGSGIYRNVRLVVTDKLHVSHWGTYITTPEVTLQQAKIVVTTKINNSDSTDRIIRLRTTIFDPSGKRKYSTFTESPVPALSDNNIVQAINLQNPELWSIENPALYKAVSQVIVEGDKVDEYETNFGIRFFNFDIDKGFSLNGVPLKIRGVCNHHDLGCLGAAVNERALERQLEILKEMGCNAIRTSHNPPAPELLNLCDKMGFLVMDEMFDMWKKGKTPYDFSLFWDEWHEKDLRDFVLRDRNHPSVIVWSIGNEVVEQWDKEDTTGIFITRELVKIVKDIDTTRPVIANCNNPNVDNPLFVSDALDIIGYSYQHNLYDSVQILFPGKVFMGSETTSALATRGYYDMPSDSIRRWPVRWDLPFTTGNPDNTVSAYDNASAPWGSTHEETLKLVKKYDYVSGMFVWTGFDYLGEPTPYGWPSRSSYFGIVDLAGFPKDAYYLYQSEWTNKPVLHVFPHWNWNEGDTIDIWAYFNCDEVELFLNGESKGVRQKLGEEMHVMWRLNYNPGTIKVIGRTDNKEVISKQINTAGKPAKIELSADRKEISANGKDLSFITVKILDENGNLVPDADNMVTFEVNGEGYIASVDNGSQTSHEPFKANYRKAFNGLCLAVVQSTKKAGKIKFVAKSDGIAQGEIVISSK